MFDEPNLVSAAGLVPLLALAEAAGLARPAQQQLSVPTDKGANAGLKVASLVAGMVAGADSIDDMRLLRHGGMGRVVTGRYASSTLGSFLRSFTFGHGNSTPWLPGSWPGSRSGHHYAGTGWETGWCWSMSTTRSWRCTVTPSRHPMANIGQAAASC